MSILSEQSVIGGVLLVPDRFIDVADKLNADDFTDHRHGCIWDAFITLDANNSPIDIVTVAQHLEFTGKLNAAGGFYYIGEIAKNTPSAANIISYAENVFDESVARKLTKAGSEISELSKARITTREKIDKAQSILSEVSDVKQQTGPKRINESLSAFIDELQLRNDSKGGLIGKSTGLIELDRKLNGLRKTDLIIVAGRPSMGKTTLAMNFAEVTALSGGNALVFEMEMSTDQLTRRMVSSMKRINHTSLTNAELDDSSWTKVTDAVKCLRNVGLYVDETPGLTILDLRARARRIHKQAPLDLIVVDYIQLMEGEGENQNNIITKITRGLKGLAKELNIPIVALSQLNRSLEQRSNKRPIMSDLRESGAIEQDADVVIFVYRDEVYNENTLNKGSAELIISKHRNGEQGKVITTFSGQYCRFDNFIGEYIEESETKTNKKWNGGFNG